MKILTGELKGRSFQFRPHPKLRPTSDKVKKAIFDVLQGQINGKRALDLFCGTGALGLEALSNGASFVSFVECDKIQSDLLDKNLKKLGLAQKSRVIADDALKAIRALAAAGERFDLFFLDPPYGRNLAQEMICAVEKACLWLPGSLFVAECAAGEPAGENFGNFRLVKTKRHGDTEVHFYSA